MTHDGSHAFPPSAGQSPVQSLDDASQYQLWFLASSINTFFLYSLYTVLFDISFNQFVL
jgi:hypothetical protein